MRRLVLASLLLFAILALMPSGAMAATDEDVFRASDRVVVPAGETIRHDLYAAGETVTIAGTVDGDVVALARRVVVTGTVRGDLWAAGQEIQISGTVEGDVRGAGERLSVVRGVGRNVVGLGNTVVIEPGAVVGGDVIAMAGTLSVDGTVRGDVSGEVGAYTASGSVGGRQAVRISEAEEPKDPPGAGDWFLARGRLWLSIVVLGAVLGLLWRRRLLSLSTSITGRPLSTLGWGFLAIPVIVAVLLAILIGIIALGVLLGLMGLGGLTAFTVLGGIFVQGVILLSATFVATLLAGTLMSLAGGRFALERYTEGRRFAYVMWLAAGALVYAVLQSLPYAGALVALAAALFALGAVARWLWSAGPFAKRVESSAAE